MQQQTLPFGTDAKKPVPTISLAPRKSPMLMIPADALRLLSLTGECWLASWAAAYLQNDVAGVQALHTFEAKLRDLVAFVAWMAKGPGVAAVGNWVQRDTNRNLRALERGRKVGKCNH